MARGGFGGAPKFPPSMVLEFLLRHHARTGSADALAMARGTCEAMARGGIHDQLAGGFARYAVDAGWVVPHFEKMLYDNALLLRAYTALWRATGDDLALRVAGQTADFLLRDLRTPEGAFASALDADTVVDGRSHEGLTYAWTPDQLAEVLGPDDGARAARLLGVTAEGTFEHGASTLQLREEPDDPHWWGTTRARLLAARDARPQPGRDDKVVTAWNGLAVAALADAGVALQRPDLVTAAEEAATFVLDAHDVDGMLRRTSRGGRVGPAPAVLDDHADLADGLLALHQATGQARWATAAGSLLDRALERFVDADGTVHDTAHDAPALFARPAGAPTTPSPRGCRHSPARCSPSPPSPGPSATAWPPPRPSTPAAPSRTRTPASPGAPSRSPRRSPPARSRWPWSARGRRRSSCSTSRGRAPHRGPSSSPGCRTRPASRSSPAARSSTAGRRRTCAGASSATGPSRTPRTCGPPWPPADRSPQRTTSS